MTWPYNEIEKNSKTLLHSNTLTFSLYILQEDVIKVVDFTRILHLYQKRFNMYKYAIPKLYFYPSFKLYSADKAAVGNIAISTHSKHGKTNKMHSKYTCVSNLLIYVRKPITSSWFTTYFQFLKVYLCICRILYIFSSVPNKLLNYFTLRAWFVPSKNRQNTFTFTWYLCLFLYVCMKYDQNK